MTSILSIMLLSVAAFMGAIYTVLACPFRLSKEAQRNPMRYEVRPFRDEWRVWDAAAKTWKSSPWYSRQEVEQACHWYNAEHDTPAT